MEICPEKSVHLSALKVPQVGSTRRMRCCQRVVITIISVSFDPTCKNFSNFQVRHFPPWNAQATCVRTKFLIGHTVKSKCGKPLQMDVIILTRQSSYTFWITIHTYFFKVSWFGEIKFLHQLVCQCCNEVFY